MLPGVGVGQAFLGETFAIVAIGGLTALGAIRHLRPVRRTVAAVLVALPYLIASLFAHAAFRATTEAVFVLATAVALLQAERQIVVGSGSEERPLATLVTVRLAKLAWGPLAVPAASSSPTAWSAWPGHSP